MLELSFKLCSAADGSSPVFERIQRGSHQEIIVPLPKYSKEHVVDLATSLVIPKNDEEVGGLETVGNPL